jgi:hypothetical protein
VVIALPFAVGRFAMTFEQWDACVAPAAATDTDHTIPPGSRQSTRNRREPE